MAIDPKKYIDLVELYCNLLSSLNLPGFAGKKVLLELLEAIDNNLDKSKDSVDSEEILKRNVLLAYKYLIEFHIENLESN